MTFHNVSFESVLDPPSDVVLSTLYNFTSPELPNRSSVLSPASSRPSGAPADLNAIRLVTMSFYLTTFVFGLAGNTLVIYVIARFHEIRNRSVSNFYILNLAAADELFLMTLPLYCVTTYTQDWPFGDVACRLMYAVRETNKYASVLTLVALSVDRCLATYGSVARFRRINVGVGVCVAVWIVCIAGAGAPFALYSSVQAQASGKRSCRVQWPHSLGQKQARTYGYLVVGLAVPFAVIAFVNGLLLHRLRMFAGAHKTAGTTSSSSCRQAAGGPTPPPRAAVVVRRSSNGTVAGSATTVSTNAAAAQARSSAASRRREKASRNMVRLVLAIVAIFAVCQLPYYVMEVVSLYVYQMYVERRQRPTQNQELAFIYGNTIAQVLVFVSSGCNPIVYGVFNKNYRKLYRTVLCCRGTVTAADETTSLNVTRRATAARLTANTATRNTSGTAASAAAATTTTTTTTTATAVQEDSA